jgi:hypothetical protein
MRGFVIELRKAKNEDMIATILTPSLVGSYYRFFGARHSILQLGHLIDFEVEGEGDRFMPHLRGLSHFGFEWLYDHNRLQLWHNFINLLAPHLKDSDIVEPFYYDLLLQSAQRWHKQNPKRIICDSFASILHYEGRVHREDTCYICEEPLGQHISLMRALIPTHPHCIGGLAIDKEKFFDFLDSGSSIYYGDEEIDMIYGVILRGL